MKILKVTAILFLAAAVSFGQNNRPVKINLLAYFDKVPAPPATSKEAHVKCDCNNQDYAGSCKAGKIFKSLEEELIKLQNDISSPPGTAQGDLVKKMQDPAFQKEMEKMSDAEKMNLALEMQQSAGMTPKPISPEPPTVMAALNEYSNLNEAEAQALMKAGEMMQARQKREQELAAKHKSIDEWKDAEIKKLPLKQYGESSEPDPKAVYAMTISAWKKHLNVVDDALKVSSKLWGDEKAKRKKQYAPFQASLEKTHYGADAANDLSKSSLGSGQILMIGALTKLVGESKSLYEDAANWYEGMVQYEKQSKQ